MVGCCKDDRVGKRMQLGGVRERVKVQRGCKVPIGWEVEMGMGRVEGWGVGTGCKDGDAV